MCIQTKTHLGFYLLIRVKATDNIDNFRNVLFLKRFIFNSKLNTKMNLWRYFS